MADRDSPAFLRQLHVLLLLTPPSRTTSISSALDIPCQHHSPSWQSWVAGDTTALTSSSSQPASWLCSIMRWLTLLLWLSPAMALSSLPAADAWGSRGTVARLAEIMGNSTAALLMWLSPHQSNPVANTLDHVCFSCHSEAHPSGVSDRGTYRGFPSPINNPSSGSSRHHNLVDLPDFNPEPAPGSTPGQVDCNLCREENGIIKCGCGS